MSYTKLFNSIVTSTIWSEDDKTRILWITLLAMADKNGEIQSSIPGLAKISSISIGDVEIALRKFMSPDKYSRTKDDEGRRIEEIDGGWALLNHEKYRKKLTDDDRKEKATERKRRYRAKLKRNEKKEVSPDCPAPVHGGSLQNPQAEAEAESEADTKTPPPSGRGSGGKGKLDPEGEKTLAPVTLEEATRFAFDNRYRGRQTENALSEYFVGRNRAGWRHGKTGVLLDWKSDLLGFLSFRKIEQTGVQL